MADGDHGHRGGKRPTGTRFDFASKARQARDQAIAIQQSRDLHQKPRIAYTGEEFGFGFRAIQEFSETTRKHKGYVPDGGFSAAGHFHPKPLEILFAGMFGKMPSIHDGHGHGHGDHGHAPVDVDIGYSQPLRTKDQALTAVQNDTAEYALVPFYQAGVGYDVESITLMSKLFAPFGVMQIEASDHYCLAVYEPQVLDVIHSAHPSSGLTDLLRRPRRSWDGNPDRGVSLTGNTPEGAMEYQAGLNVDRAGQMMLRDRVETVFAGPEPARRCKAKLDGLRAAGVKVEETAEWIEPHREMGRRVRDSLDGSRQTYQSFDPVSGQMRISSIASASQQTRPLYAIVLPFELASRSPEFTIIDDNIEDGAPPKKRFLVCQKVYDLSLFEEVFRLTSVRVAYWMKRFGALVHDAKDLSPETGGVRILLQFVRQGPVSAFGDVESFLRRFGIRYATFQMGDGAVDSPQPKRPGASIAPPPVVFDIELDIDHFHEKFDDGMYTRSVVEGLLFRAFNRKRYQMARFLAAFPYETRQLLPQQRVRWWYEGVKTSVKTWKEETEALFGPIVAGLIAAPVIFVANIIAEFFAICAVLFSPTVRGWLLGGGALLAAVALFWSTPVGVLANGVATVISGLLGKFGLLK